VKDLVPCTQQELENFVAAYPRKLERDVFGACEPPLVTYNDWTLGAWPESVVASHHMGYPEGSPPPYSGGPSNFRIALGVGGSTRVASGDVP
jgi:hypothetical protein